MERNLPPTERRDLETYRTLRRSPAESHWRTQRDLQQRREEVVPDRSGLKRLADYIELRILKWLWHYVRSRLGRKAPLPDYTGTTDTGVYALGAGNHGDEIRISLAGDWATGTEEADRVGRAIRRFRPHYTIHLGDVYYVGAPFEVREHCFGRVEWPIGSVGSFALNGNHEMYARGVGYFDVLLPRLGLIDPETGQARGQRTSYFCLEDSHWRLLGLDTGYHSVGLPLIERLIRPSHRLPASLVEWLECEVGLGRDDARGLILLTHHQYYSAFENGYPRAARQLRRFSDRPVLWFWGHEHRLAVYGRYGVSGGIEAFGRCLGHGGMPVEKLWQAPRRAASRALIAYDHREAGRFETRFTRLFRHRTPYGYNGFANLTFVGPELRVDYRDHTDRPLATERWRVDSGRLVHLGFHFRTTAAGFVRTGVRDRAGEPTFTQNSAFRDRSSSRTTTYNSCQSGVTGARP